MYCKNRGVTKCCFVNESCSETYESDVKSKLEEKPVAYLKNPKEILNKRVSMENYDTCHTIKGYDASKCAEDCNDLKRSKFAKKCEKNNGVYKCCIRQCNTPRRSTPTILV